MQMIPDKHYCRPSKPTVLQAHLDATATQIGQCVPSWDGCRFKGIPLCEKFTVQQAQIFCHTVPAVCTAAPKGSKHHKVHYRLISSSSIDLKHSIDAVNVHSICWFHIKKKTVWSWKINRYIGLIINFCLRLSFHQNLMLVHANSTAKSSAFHLFVRCFYYWSWSMNLLFIQHWCRFKIVWSSRNHRTSYQHLCFITSRKLVGHKDI